MRSHNSCLAEDLIKKWVWFRRDLIELLEAEAGETVIHVPHQRLQLQRERERGEGERGGKERERERERGGGLKICQG